MKFQRALRWAVAAATAVAVSGDCPEGCPKACPKPIDVQSDFVKNHFDYQKFWGTYYELAYHDNTQPRGFPDEPWEPFPADCMRSVKSSTDDPAKPKNYKDLFSLNFGFSGGYNAVCDLRFNVTENPGIFVGHWSGSMRPDLHTVSNTVIDVGVAENGTYTWSLEFQCNDDPEKGVVFAAVNFYHRKPIVEQSEFDEMMTHFKKRGIDWVITTKPGLKMVNQKKCVDHQSYPAEDAAVHWCGQTKSMRDVVVV